MKRTSGFAVAVILLILIPSCKKNPPAPQTKQISAKVEESPAEQKSKRTPEQGKESPAKPKGDIDPLARQAADRFLKTLKIADSPEGKKTLAEMKWRRTMKFPDYLESAMLSEEMFTTDIPGVKGYKQLLKLAIPRDEGRPFVKHYLLIAYEDKKERAWKIFDFTEATNAQKEAEGVCGEKPAEEGDQITPQGRDMHCSYWLLMEGKVVEAEKMAKKANELYAQDPAPDDEARYYKTQADATLEMISRMTGERT